MMPSTELATSYFGPAERSLFGCYNGPRPGHRRSCAVVICQPLGHEYINSHRALRQLALRISNLGFPVLRFDYFGCGDSSGDGVECSAAQCVDDISHAIADVRQRTQLKQICLIGLRLGASFALLAAAQQNEIAALALWDPIVDGKKYLDDVTELNRNLLRFRPKPQKHRASDWPKDIIGFPIERTFYEEIGEIDLLKPREVRARDILIVETSDDSAIVDLEGILQSRDATVARQHVDAPQIWIPTEDGGLQVPVDVLQFVSSWLDRMCP